MNDAPILPPRGTPPQHSPARDAPAAPRTRRPRTWLRMAIVLVALGLLGGGLYQFHQFKSGIIKQIVGGIMAQRPTVATATATTRPWQSEITASGTLVASQGINLAAEVAGIVAELHIDSGTDVAAGTVLLRLRDDVDTARRDQLKAAADLAASTLARDRRQLQARAVSQATVEADEANLRSAQAQLAAQQALIDQKIVRAPFAGRLGIRQVDLGQYLAAGTAIVALQALDPIFLDVHVPQHAVGEIRVGQPAEIRTTAGAAPLRGKVTAIDSLADAASRMTRLRISLPNPGGRLLPGMFATASIAVGQPVDHVTVPATALSVNPYGTLVYLVREDGRDADGKPKLVVHQQFVTTGDARGDQVAVLKGLKAGDIVVTAGQLKLRNNLAVLVNNDILPSDDAHPGPADR
jgi:membrane fusion protein (multidrug efflux system)